MKNNPKTSGQHIQQVPKSRNQNIQQQQINQKDDSSWTSSRKNEYF